MLTQSKRKLRQRKTYKLTIIMLLACLCVISTIVCVAVGSVDYTVAQVVEAFQNEKAEARLIIWNVRLPRILCGGIVGICLSLAGCILQGVMRNPMADPGITGISSGASVIVMIVMLYFPGAAASTPIFGFIGGILACVLIYSLAWKQGLSAVRIVLAGVAVNSILGGM